MIKLYANSQHDLAQLGPRWDENVYGHYLWKQI